VTVATTPHHNRRRPGGRPTVELSRRQVLAAAATTAAGLALGACTGRPDRRARVVGPSAGVVGQAEARRRRPGAPVRQVALTAAPVSVDLAGRTVTTWAYNDTVPGPLVRLRAGEVLRARLDNRLGEPTTIHWHGVALRNDMDGAPGMTQPPVAPGGRFAYEFTVPDPGTYWFHPHVGLQLDRGLYGPLLVDDPAEPGRYDLEQVVVLDDWTDGIGLTPEQLQARLAAPGGMMGQGGMGMMGQSGQDASPVLGGTGGQIDYPLYLLNGRPPADPPTIHARPGERLRLRVVNAAAETAFRVALGGHRLTVTHSDGLPVAPVTVDALVVGMASATTRSSPLPMGSSRWSQWPRASAARRLAWCGPLLARPLPRPCGRASLMGGCWPLRSCAPTRGWRCRRGRPTAPTGWCCRAG
jgi:FtsP/CotA-like multicopper oxidase with cupredoxin domain